MEEAAMEKKNLDWGKYRFQLYAHRYAICSRL